MNATINLLKNSEIQRVGTQALLEALGPVGMVRYLEEHDGGGAGIIQRRNIYSRKFQLMKSWEWDRKKSRGKDILILY